jgi:ubiquitin carboxyl-terminal hydrolase L5
MGQKRKAAVSKTEKVKKSKISTRRSTSTISESVESGDNPIIKQEEATQVWPGWATVESEPVCTLLSVIDILSSNISNVNTQAIFTQIIKDLGIADVKVQELYDTEEDTLRSIKDAHGIIFLFRWKAEQIDEEIETTCPEGIWFANQVSVSPVEGH